MRGITEAKRFRLPRWGRLAAPSGPHTVMAARDRAVPPPPPTAIEGSGHLGHSAQPPAASMAQDESPNSSVPSQARRTIFPAGLQPRRLSATPCQPSEGNALRRGAQHREAPVIREAVRRAGPCPAVGRGLIQRPQGELVGSPCVASGYSVAPQSGMGLFVGGPRMARRESSAWMRASNKRNFKRYRRFN